MNNIKEKTDEILQLIPKHIELAAELLIDYARSFSNNEKLENEAVLLNLEIKISRPKPNSSPYISK